MNAGSSIDHYISVMLSPPGLIGGLVLVALIVAMIVFRKIKWIVLTLAVFFSIMGEFVDEYHTSVLAFPFETFRHYARPATFALLASLIVPALISERGWRSKWVLGATIAFFVLELLFCFRLGVAGIANRAILGAVVYICIFCVFAFGLSRWLQKLSDVHTAIRCITIVGCLYTLGTCYQLVIDPKQVIINDRLFGITNNAVWAGTLMALCIPPICYLILSPLEKKAFRIFLAPILGLMVVMIMWTGSRTGVAMAMIGVGLLFRTRLGKMTIILGIGGIFTLLAMQFFSESTNIAERLVSTENTRQEPWAYLFSQFLSSPIYGTMGLDNVEGAPDIQENSYLAIAARMGILGITVLIIAVSCLFSSLAKLQLARRQFQQHAMLVDLVTAGFVSLAAGAVFEGYLLGTLVFPVFFTYTYLAITAYLIDALPYIKPATQYIPESQPVHQQTTQSTTPI